MVEKDSTQVMHFAMCACAHTAITLHMWVQLSLIRDFHLILNAFSAHPHCHLCIREDIAFNLKLYYRVLRPSNQTTLCSRSHRKRIEDNKKKMRLEKEKITNKTRINKILRKGKKTSMHSMNVYLWRSYFGCFFLWLQKQLWKTLQNNITSVLSS